MKEVVIVAAKRTPIGSFGGSLSSLSAVDLATDLLKKIMADIKLPAQMVDEVILGNVLSAGLGQNPARQVALHAGLPDTTPAFTVNKVCGSGLKAVQLAAQSIALGDADIVIAGGTESMSNAPYLVPNQRWGNRLGHASLVDTLLKDGLTDAFDDSHMGITAENIAEKYQFSRQEQDAFALESQKKAQMAIESGRFKAEISPIEIADKKGNLQIIDKDEYPRLDMTIEKLSKLKPAFKKEGTVTAGNASGINDGAALLVLMSRERAEALGLNIRASLIAYASAGVSNQLMGLGPIPATRLALEKAGLNMSQIDLVEANEAFAAQALSVIKELEIDTNRVNVNGGAIALGHPIGASGARILVTLLHEMEKRDVKRGLSTLCVGGGQGISLIISRS